MWQGREISWATGLYYFRARWYDPITGRWLSNDPIGISGGLNQYVFCGDNPVTFIDPLGLYTYGTDNLGIAFLREINPFNFDGSLNRQVGAVFSLAMGDRQAANQWSGTGQLDANCAARGWHYAYWGGVGISAFGVSGAGVANLFNAGAARLRPYRAGIFGIRLENPARCGYMLRMTTDRIHIRDLALRCVIGLYPEERREKQDIIINIALEADLAAAAASDQIADTVDYKALKKKVLALVETSSFNLIETLADRIAQLALEEARVRRATVTVDKPGALRFARSVAVEVTRGR